MTALQKYCFNILGRFLPHVTSAKRITMILSVCLSVTLRYHFNKSWPTITGF